MKVSAVVLTYQRQDLLAPCLRSLRAACASLAWPTEIIVVDNGSPGNAASTLVAEWLPDARIVTLADNQGYAGGVVHGIEHCTGEWVLTIGDDAVIAPDALGEMLSAVDGQRDVGSVAAKMLFAETAVINSAGLEIDHLGIATDRLLGIPTTGGEQTTTEVFGTSGGAALYRRAMLESIGGFDPSFELYLEDADVAWRARRYGWRCLYVPSAVVWHHHSATTGHRSSSKHFHVGRNRVRLLAKNASRRQLLRYGALMFAYDAAYVTYGLLVDRSTAPLRGRLSGIRSWRQDRQSATAGVAAPLLPIKGLRGALERNRAWVHGSDGSDG